MRKGALLGIIASVFGIIALFLNLVSFTVGPSYGFENLDIETQYLSVFSCLQNNLIGYEAQQAFEIIFNSFLILSIAIAGFSLWSNFKNFIALITLLLSGIHLTASVILFKLGPEALQNLENSGNVNFGIGLYMLIVSGALGTVAAILALLKK